MRRRVNIEYQYNTEIKIYLQEDGIVGLKSSHYKYIRGKIQVDITMRRFSNKYESIMSQEHDIALNAKLVLNYKHKPMWGDGSGKGDNSQLTVGKACEYGVNSKT